MRVLYDGVLTLISPAVSSLAVRKLPQGTAGFLTGTASISSDCGHTLLAKNAIILRWFDTVFSRSLFLGGRTNPCGTWQTLKFPILPSGRSSRCGGASDSCLQNSNSVKVRFRQVKFRSFWSLFFRRRKWQYDASYLRSEYGFTCFLLR